MDENRELPDALAASGERVGLGYFENGDEFRLTGSGNETPFFNATSGELRVRVKQDTPSGEKVEIIRPARPSEALALVRMLHGPDKNTKASILHEATFDRLNPHVLSRANQALSHVVQNAERELTTVREGMGQIPGLATTQSK